MTTVFAKIIRGEIPCRKVFENDRILAFHDINPKAPVHILIVPKKPIPNLAGATPEDSALLGEALLTAKQIAQEQGIGENFRVITNSGPLSGQEVFHIHFHLLGGRALGTLG